MCHMSYVFFFNTDKVVELVGGGLVINRAYPVYFFSNPGDKVLIIVVSTNVLELYPLDRRTTML